MSDLVIVGRRRYANVMLTPQTYVSLTLAFGRHNLVSLTYADVSLTLAGLLGANNGVSTLRFND